LIESYNPEIHNGLLHSDVRLAHILPTTREAPEMQDPDLAHVVASWHGLPDEVKRQMIAIIEANAK
jgi:hypothetical protein